MRRIQFLGVAALGLTLGAALTLGGCARVRSAPAGPGVTTIAIANHVSAPAELDRVVVTVDGTALPLSAVPPPDEDPATIAALPLGPGPHTIAVRATARGGGETLVVASQRIFHVGAAPAAIAVDVASGGDATGERVAVRLAMRGGKLVEDVGEAAPEGKDARCAPLEPVPRALCRAAADLDEAARKNDIVGVLCVRDRLTQMRYLGQIHEATRGEAASEAALRVARLAEEVERCAGEVSIGPDGVTVTRDGR